MAKDDKKQSRSRSIDNSLDIIDSKMEDIFQNTYSSRKDNRNNLNDITDDIYDVVNTILSNNQDVMNVPNITRLYTRLSGKKDNEQLSRDEIKDITDVFTNSQLISSITTTPETSMYLKQMDAQYDLICKYMPKLEKALEIKKDNVLSADNFNKEFINVLSDELTSNDKAVFDDRNRELKKRYNLDILFDEIYDDTSKYGEYFLYCVPYKKALEELLKTKGITSIASVRCESTKLMENGNYIPESNSKDILDELKRLDGNGSINLEFDTSNMLSDVVLQYKEAEKLKNKLSKKRSMSKAFTEDTKEDKLNTTISSNKVFDDALDYGKEYNSIATDGLVTKKSNKVKVRDDIEVNEIPGCICKKLKHENVRPIYIEEVCLGYLYFEFSFDDNYDPARNNIINSSTYPRPQHSENDIYMDNPLLRDLASKICNNVNATFINANQDLKDEIYIMLKYNDKFNVAYNSNNIRVTYLPPEDVYHFYFKMNKETHHGISDLERSLVPAMFWCLVDLSTTLGIVTRSQDKRIYYVKQNVDTNVARSMMNVINQVKKGNMGIRQMESMNNILNVVGRYNDHVIPMGPNGDAPIQFEVMSGQNIESPDSILSKWEELAIDATDVPLEFVNSSMQTDFAIKYTMSNSIFLRKIYKRQFLVENKFTDIYTRIYNYEYQENEFRIKVTLPAPAFLSMTNGSQLLQNTLEFIRNIAEMEYPNGPDDEKAEFIRLLTRHYMPTHINVPLIDKNKELAKANMNVLPKEEE